MISPKKNKKKKPYWAIPYFHPGRDSRSGHTLFDVLILFLEARSELNLGYISEV